ncbi:MAG: ABC transporter ATP-binding protein [Pseudanabaenaceae cyanobacterium]
MLQVQDLRIQFRTDTGLITAVDGISFSLEAGQSLGIVGESGSGKSATALALMGLLPPTAQVTGKILFQIGEEQIDLLSLSTQAWRKLRGDRLAMVFQEPMSSLNPLFTCGQQIMEAIQAHQQVTPEQARQQVINLCREVRLPDPEQIIKRYPHQLSGGQIQRVMIAMAIASHPALLLADEPTTALDVTVQATILQLLKELQQERQMGLIFISHDLGVIGQVADWVMVMYKGRVVEQGKTREIFANPQHPYTKGLIACRPQPELNLKILPTVSDFMEEMDGQILSKEPPTPILVTPAPPTAENTPLLRVENLTVSFPVYNVWGMVKDRKVAVDNISFEVLAGETLGVVGESGCGKSTTGKAILQLVKIQSGKIYFEGQDITSKLLPEQRRHLQIIFQDPFGSLNPRMTIGQIIAEPLEIHRGHIYKTKRDRLERVKYLLERVGINDPNAINRFPHEFSGGQRQRIGIARALALNPKLIIADEAVSALDVSIQAQVLNLLKELQAEFNLTYIFISHDLSVVKHMSDRILVMEQGKIVEIGTAEQIYYHPHHEYTKQLIAAIPKLELATL